MPVISRGYCMRCYRQVLRGREPIVGRPLRMVGAVRVALSLPGPLVKAAKKAARPRQFGRWVADAMETKLKAGKPPAKQPSKPDDSP
jgi:hypothetical protein